MKIARPAAGFAALALLGMTTLAACGSSTSAAPLKVGGPFGSIPAQTGTPTGTGTLSLPEFQDVPPSAIFPVVDAAEDSIGSVTMFENYMWRPLIWSPTGNQYKLEWSQSIETGPPTISNGGKTFTITLNPAYKWSNGSTVSSTDVLFDIALIKAAIAISPSDYAGFAPGQFPLNLTSVTAPNASTVVFTFNKAYNPNWITIDEIGSITPIPTYAWDIDKTGGSPVDWHTLAGAESIYKYLEAANSSESTWATNKLWTAIDGPFTLTSINPSTGSFTMVPNKAYTGPDPAHFTQLDMLQYTSDAAEFDALQSGVLTIGLVPSENFANIPALKSKGFTVWGYPTGGMWYITLNFADTTNHWNDIIGQLYVRQALQHLMNQPAMVKGIFHEAAIVSNGPTPSLPPSTFLPTSATTADYPYSISAAKSLLTSHGWKVVPNGTTTCVKPGSASDECGAGIPAGANLNFTLPYAPSPDWIASDDIAFASAARQLGITVSTTEKSFTDLISDDNDVAAPADANKWQANDFGGFTESDYPTEDTIFNTGGTNNMGDFNNSTLNTDINNSLNSTNPTAVETENNFEAHILPVLFEPNADNIWAWTKAVSGPPSAFETLALFVYLPNQFYFVKS
jgi:peptide/nickel transport system substrate-binding protein